MPVSYAGARGVGLDSLFHAPQLICGYGAFESELLHSIYSLTSKSTNLEVFSNEFPDKARFSVRPVLGGSPPRASAKGATRQNRRRLTRRRRSTRPVSLLRRRHVIQYRRPLLRGVCAEHMDFGGQIRERFCGKGHLQAFQGRSKVVGQRGVQLTRNRRRARKGAATPNTFSLVKGYTAPTTSRYEIFSGSLASRRP